MQMQEASEYLQSSLQSPVDLHADFCEQLQGYAVAAKPPTSFIGFAADCGIAPIYFPRWPHRR
jgi:hypothetical protein